MSQEEPSPRGPKSPGPYRSKSSLHQIGPFHFLGTETLHLHGVSAAVGRGPGASRWLVPESGSGSVAPGQAAQETDVSLEYSFCTTSTGAARPSLSPTVWTQLRSARPHMVGHAARMMPGLAQLPFAYEDCGMSESETPRSGAITYFCVAVVLFSIAVASVVWVLKAPPAADDQGTRATFAGWALGVLMLLLAVVAAILGLKRKRSVLADPGVAISGNVIGGRQDVSGDGTAYMGGTHNTYMYPNGEGPS